MRYTFDQYIALASSLSPRDAIGATTIRRDKCVTPVVTEMVYGGNSVLLQGKPGAGYVRVSTERQKEDGFSVDEQIHRIVHFFLDRRQPFAIYSDASLSGFYPPQNQRLIDRMIEKHAKRYERNFRTIFLSGKGVRHFSPTERAGMERHLQDALSHIRKAGSVVVTNDGEIALERKGRVKYRPALTLLLEDLPKYELVAVSDLSRLYRNEAIAAELCDRLEGCDTRIVGLIESLDYLNMSEEDDGASMQRWFFGRMAEKQLNTITVNTLRGTLQMLEQGKPHAKLPYFLARDKDGYAVYKPQAKEAILRLIDLVTTPTDLGQRRSYIDVSIQIQQEFPRLKLGHKMEWDRRRITDMLSNRALVGKHTHFGLEFDIGTRLIDDVTFERLQALMDDTKQLNPRHRAALKRTLHRNETGVLEEKCYLATGLLRCVCGGRMCHHPFRGFEGYICTSQVESRIKSAVQGEPPIRHTRLMAQDLHQFLREFIRSYRDYFSGMAHDDERYVALRRDVAESTDRLLDAKVQLQKKTDLRRRELATEASAQGFEGADAEQFVALHVRRDTKSERQTVEHLQARSEELHAELRLYVAQADAERINAKIEQWDALPVREQNAILLTVFDRFEVRGDDPCCVIVPVYRTGKELPPIPLKTAVKRTRAGDRETYTRRLPTVAEYIERVFASRLERSGGETR